MLGDRAEHEWAGDPRSRGVVEHLLAGLDLDRSVDGLSGGERRRVSLARLLLDDLDVLLLDEPTNHLDVEAVAWLADHLADRGDDVGRGHPRPLVPRRGVHDDVGGARRRRSTRYDGGYAAFVLAKAERMRQAAAAETRRQNLVRKELAWLRRGPPARTSKPKFRMDAAWELIEDEPPPRDTRPAAAVRDRPAGQGRARPRGRHHHPRRPRPDRPRDLAARAGRPGRPDRRQRRRQDVGAVGAGRRGPPDAGRLRTGRTVELAHLSQNLDHVDPAQRVLDSVESIKQVATVGKGREMTATSMLERFGFTGDKLTARIGDLSGGERRRLQLLRLLLGEPNVLLLDEPTNDLDIETLNVVEDFLDGWPGTLVVISHDRYFLERVCDTTWALLGDGSLVLLPGGVDEYLRRRTASRRRPMPVASVRRASAATAAGDPDAADERAAKKELAKLDRQLAKLSDRIDARARVDGRARQRLRAAGRARRRAAGPAGRARRARARLARGRRAIDLSA